MEVRAAVLERFDEPLVLREYPVQPLDDQEVLVRIRAGGVCGSDVHIWRGKDPRTPLPIILGHEGVGEIADIGGEKHDVFGRELYPGDLVVWERGIMCGRCEYCVIRKQPALCPHRRTYGISISCKEPPHLLGAYAECMRLLPSTPIIKIEEDIDPAVLVPAVCSGATAAHTVEQAGISPGDAVLVIGPGPLGLFALAFAKERGAGQTIVFGTSADTERLRMAERIGADRALITNEHGLDECLDIVKDLTQGQGARIVIECTGTARMAEKGIQFTAPYGTILIPGIATPVGTICFAVYEHMARKNVAMRGVWVSDTSHLYQAIQLVVSRRFPLHELVTHRLPLEAATEALEAVERREAVKAVLVP